MHRAKKARDNTLDDENITLASPLAPGEINRKINLGKLTDK